MEKSRKREYRQRIKCNVCSKEVDSDQVATILAIIPATSCSAERSFSSLRKLT